MEVEEIGWVVAGLDPHQAVVVAPVVGVRPVRQVRIGEVGEHPARSPRVHQRPGAGSPSDARLVLPRSRLGGQGGQVRWKLITCGAGTVPNTNRVTTPKLPAPATRSAQNSSRWW